MPADALVEEARRFADRYAIERDLPSDRLVTLLYDLANRIEELTKPKPRARRSGGIKRTSADIRWSAAVRGRDDYTCQFPGCGRRYPDNIGQVDAAHCFGRRCSLCTSGSKKPHDCARLDLDNGITLCRPHHTWLDAHTTEKYELVRERLGDARFDALQAKANFKRDRSQGR